MAKRKQSEKEKILRRCGMFVAYIKMLTYRTTGFCASSIGKPVPDM